MDSSPPTRLLIQRLLQSAYMAVAERSWEKAAELALEAQRASIVTDDRFAEIDAAHMLARIAHESGKFDEAAREYEHVRSMAIALGYEEALARVAHEMARIHDVCGEFSAAENGFRYALCFYAKRQDRANVQAAINGLSHLADHALSVPDVFLPNLCTERLPFGPPERYLDIRATAVLAEFNDYYRRRLVQKGLTLFAHDSIAFHYALERAQHAADFVGDEFVLAATKVFLTRTELVLTHRADPPGIPAVRSAQRFDNPDSPARCLDELHEFLEPQHSAGSYGYRGQTKAYPPPLLASAFRPIIGPQDAHIDCTHTLFEHRLRKVGQHFYGEYNFNFNRRIARLFEHLLADRAEAVRNVYDRALKDLGAVMRQQTALGEGHVLRWDSAVRAGLSSEELQIYEEYAQAWRPLVDSYHRRCIRNAFFTPFGYLLGTTLAQQYGLSSEGLDATKSLQVAGFFASYEYESGFAQPRKDGIGVIYRFPLHGSDIGVRKLNQYDYYSLPSIIDTEDVLYRFERPGLDLKDALKCFELYDGAVYMDGLQDTDLFFLPEGALRQSRITAQQALIILPDEIRKDLPHRSPGAGGITFPAFRYIEDWSSRNEVEKFYFQHTGNAPECAKLRREDLWPRNDPFIPIIVAILTAVYPLSTFIPDIMPQRLDLIDGGFDHADFLRLCEEMAINHHMVLYNHEAMQGARVGAIVF
jgi:hypothetical protein